MRLRESTDASRDGENAFGGAAALIDARASSKMDGPAVFGRSRRGMTAGEREGKGMAGTGREGWGPASLTVCGTLVAQGSMGPQRICFNTILSTLTLGPND